MLEGQAERTMEANTIRFIALGLVCAALGARASQVVIKDFSVGFTKAMEDCKKEMQLPDAVMTDFANFWKDDFVPTSPKTGCAIICLSAKLELLDPEGKLHHGNTKDFAKKHGADDAMAAQLVDMIHGCFLSTPKEEDDCQTVMNISMCFKKKVHDLKWNPDMELMMGEVLAEV